MEFIDGRAHFDNDTYLIILFRILMLKIYNLKF
jgi:hypothetical protein